MSTSIGVHLHKDDKWSVQDMTANVSKDDARFVALSVHEFTALYVMDRQSADALFAAAGKAKALMDAVGKDEPS